MIITNRIITVRKGVSSIDNPVIVYRGDYEVSIKFTIMESKFRFKSGVNLVDSEKASHGQLAILTPYGGNVFSEIVKCEDGTVTFTLTKEMIDQLEEVGLYSFQIRLFDYYRESRVSIPPVEFGIEVREPVASEDHDNEVNNAIVGYSIAKVVDPSKENIGDTFDANGNYNKTDWETGDRITEGKLNKIEDAIDKINQNEKKDIANLDKRVTNNFSVLDSSKANTEDLNNVQKQVNNLVLGAVGDGNNAEVVQARGAYSTLNDRLNVMDDPVKLSGMNEAAFNTIRHTTAKFSGQFSSFSIDAKSNYTITASWTRCYLHVTTTQDTEGYIRYNIKPADNVKILNGESLYIDLDEAITNNEYTFRTAVLGTVDTLKKGNKFVALTNDNGRLSGPMANSLNIPSNYITKSMIVDQSIDFSKLDPAVDNKLARAGYQVMAPLITDWEYTANTNTLTMRNLGKMYIYRGAVGGVVDITHIDELVVKSNQIAYVDLDSTEKGPDGYLPIVISDTPFSAMIHGSNAFVIDRKIILVVNIYGRLSGPLVDKLVTKPFDSSSINQEDPMRQPGIWYKMDKKPIYFDPSTKTLTWEGMLLYLDRSDLPPNNSQRVKILPGSYTFTDFSYSACYLDLNAITSSNENDPATCIKGGAYTSAGESYTAKRGQIPIAKYDSYDKGFEVINFPSVTILGQDDVKTECVTDDRVYALVTADSQVVIMRQASEESGKYYLGTVFKHCISPSINANIWRLGAVYIYTKSDDEFTQYTDHQMVNGGEWECALKEKGASDFIGGMAHGDEMMSDILFLIDGKPVDLSVSRTHIGKKITILEHSTLNRVDTPNDIVANHVRHYEITKDDIVITQEVEWLQSLTMGKSYLTMLPIKRTTDDTADGIYITNKGFKNKYFNVLDLPYNHPNGAYQKDVTEATIWNDGPGYQMYAKVEILETNELPNSDMAFANAVQYNKIYFDYCGDGYVTQVGEVWHNKARYVLDYKGYKGYLES